jgi:anti-anti-sigma factor
LTYLTTLSKPGCHELNETLGDGRTRAVVSMTGEHDLSTVALVTAVLDHVLAAGPVDVVVDLSGIEFMGVATVGVLAQACHRLEQRSRSLVVRAPSTCARRVLQLCGEDALFEPEPELAAR